MPTGCSHSNTYKAKGLETSEKTELPRPTKWITLGTALCCLAIVLAPTPARTLGLVAGSVGVVILALESERLVVLGFIPALALICWVGSVAYPS